MIGNCSISPYTFNVKTLIKRGKMIFADWYLPILDWKSSRRNVFWPLRQNLNGTVGEEFDLESNILCLQHFSGVSASVFMMQLSALRSSLSNNQWAGKQVFSFTFCFFFFHWLLFGGKKAIPEDGWVFTVARYQPVYNPISPRHLKVPLRRKMIKFNAGLSQRCSCLRTCNSSLQNTVEPLLREKVMRTQNVTLNNTQESRMQKLNEILILD